jgi:regulator of CtrA degradation
MHEASPEAQLHPRLIDALYVEAMLLADEARDYFDEHGRSERAGLVPPMRVSFSCESLKVTTRLMHVIAWLLTQRAVRTGEMRPDQALDPQRRLGEQPITDAAVLAGLPPRAAVLIGGSVDLHRRVALLDAAQVASRAAASPVRALQERLASAF